jgi:DNA-binding NtrC family response regulator
MLVAQSAKSKQIIQLVDRIATTRVTVLLTGEEGTGRETIAHYVHKKSNYRDGPFVTINIAERLTNLVDAELFGYTKGVFPRTTRTSRGMLRSANGGTVFFKNVQDIPPEKQAILLRFIQEQEVVPVGGTKATAVDARVVATASADLEDRVRQGLFRQDLYYRLNVASIRIPPLRERTEDIVPLAKYFLRRFGPPTRRLTEAAKDVLRSYPWPGNVRELANRIQRAVRVARGIKVDVQTLDLPPPQPQLLDTAVASHLQQEVTRLRSELDILTGVTIEASPIWEGRRFNTDQNLCFVLMPFATSSDLQNVYFDHVKPTIERLQLRCERADDIHGISGVMQSVWEGINRARIVIADMTERNPNVFYELGIAHTHTHSASLSS